MVSDTERREVARRLRHAWANVPDANPIRHHLRVLCAIYEAVGFSDVESDAIDLFDRLADLIDPPYPDATASYKGWRAEVYDPDGVLVSPSNVAADLVRARADGKVPDEPKVRCVAEVKVDGERLEKLAHDAAVDLTGIDRDELLVEVKELEKCAYYFGLDFDEDESLRDRLKEASEAFAESAHSIREALGVTYG